MTASLFQPTQLGQFSINNRIAMAPMTRSRTTQPGDVPNDMMATYYGQRATAGLIITEGAPISAVGRGYSLTPGIYTQAHIDGWKKTTQAIHDKGGKVFIQLWHVGRRSHESITGEEIVSASAIKEADKVFGPLPDGGFGMIETGVPRAMSIADIQQTIADFVQAAKNAMEAGFDGVEIHAAHGYLLDQFMRLASNQRDDQYGGSQENRMRFLLETVEAVVDAIGADKVAIRVSPHVVEGFADFDPEIEALTLKVLEQLAPLNLAYLHFSENISKYVEAPESFRQAARQVYPNTIMVAGKLDKAKAEALLSKKYADLVAFGTPFVTNPDFVHRIEHNIALTDFDADARLSLYGGDEKGYIDYPTAEESLTV
ncbi:alkene reductase [Photobacterium sanctipauli]|uniref:Alkene reductase n=1 Tax=Photobacterium sanctipauli TaxID=1342794 RepID=A0A2T3P029_9GAMM|nr:alkene reductase [Photobacterium sanctipauli]PSW21857.1 alkene reductase [Photobacterium sanctipauli]